MNPKVIVHEDEFTFFCGFSGSCGRCKGVSVKAIIASIAKFAARE